MATLRQGSSGAEVKALQKKLNALGFQAGPEDGKYGPKTAAAVKAFQKAAKITVDGIAGPQTMGAFGTYKKAGAPAAKPGAKPAAKPAAKVAPATKSREGIINEVLKSEFGAIAAPFAAIPELRPLIANLAAKERGGQGWTSAKFTAAVRASNWWKTHTNTQQAWMTFSDAEKNQQIKITQAKMTTEAQQSHGMEAFNKRWGNVAGFQRANLKNATAVASGARAYEEWLVSHQTDARARSGTQAWDDDQAQKEARAVKRKRPEEIAEELWNTAQGDYMLNMSKGSAKDWASKIISGQSSRGEFMNFLRNQASKMYPDYADGIGKGLLPKSLFSPALSTIGNELELSEEQVRQNPKLWGEVASQAAGAKGQFSAADWVRYARSDSAYKNTANAQKAAAGFSEKLLQTFGAV